MSLIGVVLLGREEFELSLVFPFSSVSGAVWSRGTMLLP